MLIEHRGAGPTLAKDVYIAPNAVVSGDVEIGEGSCVLFGAVLSAEGGPIRIGRDCVIMENAVLRGAPEAPLTVGDNVLVGPRAYLTGCTVEAEAFLATGACVFNRAVVGRRAEVRINGTVHLRTRLAADATVPIGWVAVGDPARILPPEKHEEIWSVQKPLDFPRTVFGIDRPPEGQSIMPTVMPRYTRALRRHLEDRRLD
ncbi:MAG: gamma carbonic anhydrase family protein [Alphaproteobacteria bacterium]|nr:gamma carbonic anhydrase family protein [Alphaproteobacteria bacterium]